MELYLSPSVVYNNDVIRCWTDVAARCCLSTGSVMTFSLTPLVAGSESLEVSS